MRENDCLALIDSIAQHLDSKHTSNDPNGITDRQIKHAQMLVVSWLAEEAVLIDHYLAENWPKSGAKSFS